MYQLLVRYLGWQPTQDDVSGARTFEYTESDLVARFKPNGVLDVPQLMTIPALFATETGGKGAQFARIGSILSVKPDGSDYKIRYAFDESLPAIPNSRLEKLAPMLGLNSFQLSRTHWAIKDVDLFAVLLRAQVTSLHSPKVFSVEPGDR